MNGKTKDVYELDFLVPYSFFRLRQNCVVVTGGLHMLRSVGPADEAESNRSRVLNCWRESQFIYKECTEARDLSHQLQI